jgi:hypothetical protein
MPGLKKVDPSIRFSGNLVTPDEIDATIQYTIINPSNGIDWFGTLAGTQTQSVALGMLNKFADYPRNVRVSGTLPGGSVAGGTMIVNGLDQFGNSITENLVIAPLAAAGTTDGTKIFSKVTSGTFNFGTGDAGPCTVKLGVETLGSVTYFGLPTKIGATSDLKNLTISAVGTQTNGTFVFGGTPSSAAVVSGHYFKAPQTIAVGTYVLTATIKPTYNAENEDKIINL